MADIDIPGLAQVPPHLRETVRQRILVIERFLGDKRPGAARTAAAELGLGLPSFYRLVRAWSHARSATDLSGAGRVKVDRQALSQDQMDVIATAVAEMPGAIIERIGERAAEIARDRGVTMVGWAALTKHVGILATGRLPANSPAAAADLVIEHSVIDLPVGDPTSATGWMPIATLVTSVAQPRVLGLSMAEEAPSAAGTALALAEALNRLSPATPGRPVTIYLHSLEGEAWQSLREILDRPGIELIHHTGKQVSPPNATIRLIGRRLAGISTMPRLGRRPFIARPAEIEVGARPITLAEAEDFVRARWTPAVGEQVSLAIESAVAASLGDALSKLAP